VAGGRILQVICTVPQDREVETVEETSWSLVGMDRRPTNWKALMPKIVQEIKEAYAEAPRKPAKLAKTLGIQANA